MNDCEATNTSASTSIAPPLLRVLSGNPTDEELAAVVAVLAARSAGSGGVARTRRLASEWAAPRHRMRPVVRRRPDGWRRSALPS